MLRSSLITAGAHFVQVKILTVQTLECKSNSTPRFHAMVYTVFGKSDVKSRHKTTHKMHHRCVVSDPFGKQGESTSSASQCCFMTRKTKYITGNGTKKSELLNFLFIDRRDKYFRKALKFLVYFLSPCTLCKNLYNAYLGENYWLPFIDFSSKSLFLGSYSRA